jgi:hypothetical protein
MKILLESTSTIVTLKTPDGSLPARVWEGTTPNGIAVHAYVVRVFANSLDNAPAIEGEMLAEGHRDPSPLVLALVSERDAVDE